MRRLVTLTVPLLALFILLSVDLSRACCPRGGINPPKPPVDDGTPSSALKKNVQSPYAVPWEKWWTLNKDRFMNFNKAFPKDAVIANTDGTSAISEEMVMLRRLFETELKSPLFSVRLAVAIAIGKSGDASFAPALRANINDTEREVRDYTMLGLGMVKDKDSIPALGEALLDPKKHTITRGIAAYSLGFTRDPKAMELVNKLLASNEDKEDTLTACTIALGLFKDKATIPVLADILLAKKGMGSAYQKAYAALALGRIGGEDAVLAMCKSPLKEKNVDVLRSTAIALGLTRDVKANPTLLAMFENSNDILLKGLALISIAQIKAEGSYEFLINAINDKKSEELRAFGMFALGIFGDKRAIPEMRKILTDKRSSESVKSAAILSLGILKATECTKEFLEIAKSDTELETKRCYAVLAIGMMGDQTAATEIAGVFEKAMTTFDLYRDSAYALAMLGQNKIVLEKIYKDFDASAAYVKALKLGVLGNIGDRSTVKFLAKRYPNEENKTMKLLTLTALGYLLEPNHPPKLRELTADNDYEINFLSIEHIFSIP